MADFDASGNAIALTSGYIAKQACVGLYNNALLLAAVDRQYSDEFGTTSGGAKVGAQIRLRKPAQFITTHNVAMDSTTIQSVVEQTQVVTLDGRYGVHFDLDTTQLTLQIDPSGKNYDERTIQQAGHAVGSDAEQVGFQVIGQQSSNAIIMTVNGTDSSKFDITGSAGTSSANTLKQVFLKAKAVTNKQLAPKEAPRWAFVSSDLEASFVNEVVVLFHANSEIEKAYTEGTISEFAGLKWGSTDLVWTRTCGAGGQASITVGASGYTEGSTTITLTGANAGNIKAGDKLQFSVFCVNPQTKAVYTNLLVRAAEADAAGSSTTWTTTIDPIYWTAGGTQNASATVNSTTVTVLGTAGKHYEVNCVISRDAITFANADLYLPNNVEMKSREKVMDISMRYIRDYRIATDDVPSRLEILAKWAMMRKMWSCTVERQLD